MLARSSTLERTHAGRAVRLACLAPCLLALWTLGLRSGSALADSSPGPAGSLALVRLTPDGTPPDGDVLLAVTSPGGQWLGIVTTATNVDANACSNGAHGIPVLLDTTTGGVAHPFNSPFTGRIHALAVNDRGTVAMATDAALDLALDTNTTSDVYVKRLTDTSWTLASRTATGAQGKSGAGYLDRTGATFSIGISNEDTGAGRPLKVVFGRGAGLHSVIDVHDVTAGACHTISVETEDSSAPAIAPLGDKACFFVSNAQNNGNILVVVDLATSARTPVETNAGPGQMGDMASFSGNGQRIAYSATHTRGISGIYPYTWNAWVYDFPSGGVILGSTDPTGAPLIDGLGALRGPGNNGVSLDETGTKITYSAYDPNYSEIGGGRVATFVQRDLGTGSFVHPNATPFGFEQVFPYDPSSGPWIGFASAGKMYFVDYRDLLAAPDISDERMYTKLFVFDPSVAAPGDYDGDRQFTGILDVCEGLMMAAGLKDATPQAALAAGGDIALGPITSAWIAWVQAGLKP